MIRLTGGEISALAEEELAEINKLRQSNGMASTTWLGEQDPCRIANTQLKKVGEWGNERCIEHDLKGYDRRECSQCWQSLLEEVE